MSKKEKLIERVISIPSDLTWNELSLFLEMMEYNEETKGRTSDQKKAIVTLEKGYKLDIEVANVT